jgi:Flp pilus assembly protein TadG
MKRINRLRRDESGMSYVFIGLSMMAFMSASMLAIDVGMLMTARNQAQNSADAGALAGATALLYDDYGNRTSSGPAVTNAIAAAQANSVMRGQVSVNPADVEFLNDAAGEPNRVKVTVFRRASRGNAVSTLIASIFGIASADIAATATAEAAPTNAMTCVKPFTIPDKWIEKQTPPWDGDDGFDIVDKKGKPVANPDVYIGPDDPANYTGYSAERDAGIMIVLKADNGSKIAPSMYQAWDMPLYNSGGSDYRNNIANCNTSVMGYGDIIRPEPGMMTGPTAQGMRDLIDKDPNAYWDDSTKKVVSSKHPSPRVVAIPLFDPVFYDTGKRNGSNASLKFVNYLGFFVERMQGNEVVGRITPIGGLRKGAGFGPAPVTAFPKSIRLVQ